MNEHEVFAALLRSDLRAFVWKSFQTILPGTPYLPNWHIDAIFPRSPFVPSGIIDPRVHQLMRGQADNTSRLLINHPPRSFKFFCFSVAYVAWLLVPNPPRRVMVVSYANRKSPRLNPIHIS